MPKQGQSAALVGRRQGAGAGAGAGAVHAHLLDRHVGLVRHAPAK
jgi:hypothetical protein